MRPLQIQKAQHLLLSLLLSSKLQHQLKMWSIGHTKRRMLQDKTAHPRMIEYFPSLRHTQNLMARPPLTKLRTLMLEQFDYLFEPPITHAYASIRTKLRQHASRNQ